VSRDWTPRNCDSTPSTDIFFFQKIIIMGRIQKNNDHLITTRKPRGGLGLRVSEQNIPVLLACKGSYYLLLLYPSHQRMRCTRGGGWMGGWCVGVISLLWNARLVRKEVLGSVTNTKECRPNKQTATATFLIIANSKTAPFGSSCKSRLACYYCWSHTRALPFLGCKVCLLITAFRINRNHELVSFRYG
jgi:hypothetical protein